MIRFVVVLLLMALVLYGVFWAIDRRRAGPGSGPDGGPTRGTARRLPPGPIGPDDDEAFLRNLDRARRRTKEDPPPTSQENHDHPE